MHENVWDEGACKPRYDFWQRTAYWTLEEGVALTCGKEPEYFNRESLLGAPSNVECVRDFHFWLEVADRACKMGDLTSEVRPEVFLEWRYNLGTDQERFGSVLFLLEGDQGNPLHPINYRESYIHLLASHEGLMSQIDDQRGEIDFLSTIMEVSEQSASKVGRLSTDERQKKSLLKICLAVAISKYRFDPRQKKSSVPKNIETAVLEAGLSITAETIRSLLNEATATFPEVRDHFEDE